MPFGKNSLSNQNLKYLTIQQALKDLAYFIKYIKNEKLYSIIDNPWIAIGGSYPGALSAWFRFQIHPSHCRAISSSAVINAIEDMYLFDQQIFHSALKSAAHVYHLQEYVTKFKQDFKGDNLNQEQFLYYFSDITVELIQNGKRQWLCDNLKNNIDLILSFLKI